jgi:CIC family chloride channel protein
MGEAPPSGPGGGASSRPEPPFRLLGRAARALSVNLVAVGSDEQARLLALAVVIGVAAGAAAVVFYGAIDVVQAFTLRAAIRSPVPSYLVIPVILAIGLVACRGLIRWGAGGSSGETIPDVMYKVTVKGGIISAFPVLVKTAAAALVIGTGWSVGVEGPVVVAGAAVGSRIGRWLRASPHRLRTLVGCGAAAGISAAFNAPITGVVFGVEKILGTTGTMALGPFVVASILAATVGRAVFGNHPVLAMPAVFSVGSPWELVLYVGLGLITGIVSVLYSRGVWKAQDLFARLRSRWVQVALGVLLVGGLDLVFRADLWGHGHESLNLGIVASRTALFLLALTFAKLVATAITFGAGGTGGVFTPALFIGATLGGSYAVALGHLMPSWHLAPGALALVGMAGLVAGATHAPLTAIMMVFEMSGDYGLILPVMLTSVLAFVVARHLHPENIYSEWLVRRGVVLSHGADAAVLARITVAECMNRQPAVIPEDADLASIGKVTQASRQMSFPVVDDQGRLVGMLSREALRLAHANGEHLLNLVLAADLVRHDVDRVTSEDSLLTALRHFGKQDVDVLPVVGPRARDRLEGIVSREDLVAGYERALTAEGGH